jgi:O-antigen/teichoic acid export membrane protein
VTSWPSASPTAVPRTSGSGETRTPNLSRRASLNTLAAGLDYIARIAVQLIVNPILVAGLGKYLFGAWKVLWQLSGYLWASSGRSAQALQMVLAQRQHSPDEEEKRRYVASAVVVWFVFLPVLIIVGAVGAWAMPSLLKTPNEYVGAVRATTALIAADAIALALLTIPRSVLQGQNLGYKRMGLSAIFVLLGGGLMALAIYLDMGIAGVAAAQLVNTVLTGVLFLKVVRTHVPWFGLSRPSRKTVRWFLGLSGWFMGWKYVWELMTAADVLVIGFFASVELVAVYSLTKFIPDATIPLINTIVQGSSAGLGGIIGRGDLKSAIQIRNEIMALTWLIVTLVGGTFLLWSRSFVSLWVGSDLYAGSLPALLILILVIQFIFFGNDARTIDLFLNQRAKVLTGAASAALSFVLAAFLVGRFDNRIVGVCVGMIIGRAVLTVAYPWLVGRFLGYPLGVQLRGALRPALTTALLFGAMFLLGQRISADSWIELFAFAGMAALALAAVAAVIGLSRNQRRFLIVRVRKVVRGSRDRADADRTPDETSAGQSS